MSDRRVEHPERKPWPWWKRAAVGLLRGAVWLLSAFEDKRDPHRRLSMTRLTVAYFVVVVGRELRMPLGWPDAFTIWSLAFALGIARAIDSAPSAKVLEAVTGMFGRGAEAVGSYFSRTQEAGGTAYTASDVPMGTAYEDPP